MTSRNTIRWLAALGAGALAALLFRATMLTLCKLEGAAFEPFLLQGDRVVVNRWSYGLRTGADGGLFGYGRWLRQPVRRGDIIAIDIPNHTINVRVSDEELAKRKANWVKPEPKIKTGYLSRYAKLTTSASRGAVVTAED